MSGIGNFIPAKGKDDLKVLYFTYEADFKKLSQPFLYPTYNMFLVVRGEGRLKLLEKEYSLYEGTLFFGFPGVSFDIDGNDSFTYMYISFMGLRAQNLLRELGVDSEHPTRQGFDGHIDFWKTSMRHIDPRNAGILSESVLLYTLSFIKGEEEHPESENRYGVVENMIAYIDNNYTDPDMSLKKVADIFAYTDKYLSHVFKEHMHINFTNYLTRLRMQRALELMADGRRDVSKIAAECGFRDPGYFSKVFKRMFEKTPLEHISDLNQTI